MTKQPSLLFMLDTPNIWRGRALAGTPARVLALAQYAHQAGAHVTLVLCDRGVDYGKADEWATSVMLVHPEDFYEPQRLAPLLESVPTDFLLMCEAEALLVIGRELADILKGALVYDVHDDDAAVAASLGEPSAVVERHALNQHAAFDAADYVIVSTRCEQRLVRSADIGPERTVLLPNGADHTERIPWGPNTETLTLVFLGNLFYQPNARAVTAIRDTLIPALQEMEVQCLARIVGRGPVELINQSTSAMLFLGRVPTVDGALRGATMALAPLSAGSGAKMKVLDYMAAGLPVIGTSEAVTGLPGKHPGVVVEDNLTRWAKLISDLHRSPKRLEEIGAAGRMCIESTLSWRQIGSDLVNCGRSWLAKPTPRLGTPALSSHPGLPRWLEEHAGQGALPDPRFTRPGTASWIRRTGRQESSQAPVASRKGSR